MYCNSEQNFKELLAEFRRYLIVSRKRDSATADAYLRDSKVFIGFFFEHVNADAERFIITPDIFQQFHEHLVEQGLKNSTIERRLIGVRRFWSFLYKTKRVGHPSMTFDDMDIVFKKGRNPTRPLSPKDFNKFRKAARDGLYSIY